MKFKGENGYMSVTPTDIDGLVQLSNVNCCIFFELKYSNGITSTGQKTALETICDGLEKSGVHSVVFLAFHENAYPEKIIAKNALVKQIYWKGRWRRDPTPKKLYDAIQSYIRYIKEE